MLKVTQPVSKQYTEDLDPWLTAKPSLLVAPLSLPPPLLLEVGLTPLST